MENDREKMMGKTNKNKIKSGASATLLIAVFVLMTQSACSRKDPFEVAFRATDPMTGRSAVEKVSDQGLLAQLALISYDRSVREAALQKITDRYLIAKIAVTVKDTVLKGIAYGRLSGDSLSSIAGQLRQSSPYKFIDSDLSALLPVIRVLDYPEVVSKVGRIAKIEMSWSEKTQMYRISGYNAASELCKGEIFKISIKFSAGELVLNERWEAEFPTSVDLAGPGAISFFPVSVYTGDRLKPVLDCLSQSEMISIAGRETKFRENNKDYMWFADRYKSINIYADDLFDGSFDYMTYQTIVEEIALKNDNWEIRRTAVAKLWNRSLLLKIATEDKDERVRDLAAKVLYGKDN
jgi:hypothetical protein